MRKHFFSVEGALYYGGTHFLILKNIKNSAANTFPWMHPKDPPLGYSYASSCKPGGDELTCCQCNGPIS